MHLISITTLDRSILYALWSNDMAMWTEWTTNPLKLSDMCLVATERKDLKTIVEYNVAWIANGCTVNFIAFIDNPQDLPHHYPELFI